MPELVFNTAPPAEAVDYLQGKVVGGRFSFDWRDVAKEEHLASFVVAKAMKADLLADLHGGLLQAFWDGWTKERFVAELRPMLQAKGWWGKQRQSDPVTGEVRLVNLGSPRRLRTIYDTNIRMAHAAGRWERFMAAAATRPFLQYHHTPQAHPRQDHLAWDKITLPVGHAFWKTHYCPNGWGCKCFVTSLRVAEAVTGEDELQARGAYDQVAWKNRRTGETSLVPRGVDPGFDYNVGQARLAGLQPPAMSQAQREAVVSPRRPRTLPPLPAARPLPPGVEVRPDLPADPAALFDAFAAVLGKGEGEVFIDAAQVPVVVGRRMFEQHDLAGVSTGPKRGLDARAPLAEIFAQTLRDPDEIWHSLQQRQDGTSVLVRNYVAALDAADAGRALFVVSFHEGASGGVWMGSTAFGPGRRLEPRDQAARTSVGFRVGTLVYRRK
ncbi:PBECR2 nuclease fold domain-containing protein [Phenylobacterium ferrooxidans]|uniref:PBECR2 nuclease fold domain-containing protein n=1 Tax=Phenylobacterium ferrooxidans TaxID=2982689 RepID=A0ABW6CNM8_9CAUL